MDWWKQLSLAYRFNPADAIPLGSIDTGFTCTAAGFSITDAYGDPGKSLQARLKGEKRFGFLPLPRIIRHTLLGAHDFGGEVRLPSNRLDQAMKVVSYPVSDEAHVLRLRLPDPKTAGGIQTAMQFSKLEARNGAVLWFHHRSPFTMAANICGMEQFARWMIKKPELCDHLIRMAEDHIFNVLPYWIDTFHHKNIAVYNSSPMESNQLISPRHFERFALPAHERYLNRLTRLKISRYFFHICGDQKRNLPYLSQIAVWPHPAIISIGHEVDLDEAARFFPNDIIYGNINPQLLQTATAKRVYDICRDTIKKGGQIKAGFILAPGCDLPLYCPQENVSAMAAAVKDTWGFSRKTSASEDQG